MTQRELSEALLCSPRNVTGLVDALQSAGLVARRPHPRATGHATLVTLTEQGAAAVAAWQAGYQSPYERHRRMGKRRLPRVRP